MADRYLLEDGSGGYELEDGSGVLLLETIPIPTNHRTFFADGNQGVMALGAALGAALIFHSTVFIPVQPKPQAAAYQGGTQQHAQFSNPGVGRVFGHTSPLPPPQPEPQQPWYQGGTQAALHANPGGGQVFRMPLAVPARPAAQFVFAAPQVDLTQVTTVTFAHVHRGRQRAPQFIAVSPQDQTQPQALTFKQAPQGVQPYPIPQLVVPPQADPAQLAAVLFRQPPPTALLPPLHGAIVATPQADPAQIPAVVLKQQPQALQPFPLTQLSAPAQADPSQPPAVFSRIPALAHIKPFADVVFGAPQADPTNPLAAVFSRIPALAHVLPFPDVVFGAPQADPTQPRETIFHKPPPTAVVADKPAMAPVRTAYPQDPTQYQGDNFAQPSDFAPTQPTPGTPFYSSSRDDRVIGGRASLFGQTVIVPKVMPAGQELPLFQYGAEMQLYTSFVGSDFPLPSVGPAQPTPQAPYYASSRVDLQTPAPWLARFPFPQVVVAPKLAHAISAPPQPVLDQPAALVFSTPPATRPAVPFGLVLTGAPQADPTQIAADVYGTQPSQATPLDGAWIVPPQPELNQPAAQFFAAPPASALAIALRTVLTAAPQADPSLPTTLVFGAEPSQKPALRTAIVVPPQPELNQPAAQVFHKPPPAASAIPVVHQIHGAPQDDPTQRAAVVFHKQIPTAGPVPLRGAIIAAPQFNPSSQLAAMVFHKQPFGSINPPPPPPAPPLNPADPKYQGHRNVHFKPHREPFKVAPELGPVLRDEGITPDPWPLSDKPAEHARHQGLNFDLLPYARQIAAAEITPAPPPPPKLTRREKDDQRKYRRLVAETKAEDARLAGLAAAEALPPVQTELGAARAKVAALEEKIARLEAEEKTLKDAKRRRRNQRLAAEAVIKLLD